MDLISKGLLASINYGSKSKVYRQLFNTLYGKVTKIFTDHRIQTVGYESLYFPKQWSPTIIQTINEMLRIDPNVKFIGISERFGKLSLGFVTLKKDAEDEIEELLHKTQNRLDCISHGLASRAIAKVPTLKNAGEKWLLTRGVLHTGG